MLEFLRNRTNYRIILHFIIAKTGEQNDTIQGVVFMIVGRKEKALGVYKKRSLMSINYAITQIKQSKIAPFVQDLYLYGSCARNEQDYDSDVDLFLELSIDIDLDKYRSDLLILRSKVMPISDDLPEIDLRIEIGDKWKNSSLFFYQNVKKDYISIWNKKEPI